MLWRFARSNLGSRRLILTNSWVRTTWWAEYSRHRFIKTFPHPKFAAAFSGEFPNPENPDFKLFPKGLLQETRDTMALLIPYLGSRSSSWFKKETNTTTDDQGTVPSTPV
jgi:hypothetical protein